MGILSTFQFGEPDVLIISYDQLKIYQKDMAKVFNIGMCAMCDVLVVSCRLLLLLLLCYQ